MNYLLIKFKIIWKNQDFSRVQFKDKIFSGLGFPPCLGMIPLQCLDFIFLVGNAFPSFPRLHFSQKIQGLTEKNLRIDLKIGILYQS